MLFRCKYMINLRFQAMKRLFFGVFLKIIRKYLFNQNNVFIFSPEFEFYLVL